MCSAVRAKDTDLDTCTYPGERERVLHNFCLSVSELLLQTRRFLCALAEVTMCVYERLLLYYTQG